MSASKPTVAVPKTVHIEAAMPALRQPLQQMLELYQHDLSDIWDQDLSAAGCFGYELDRFESDPSCKAWVFRVDGQLAGFALVDSRVRVPGDDFWMDQFFELRKYRRQGVGQAAAAQVFQAHPGRWQVGQMAHNLAAQAFWRHTIGRFTGGATDGATGGAFEELALSSGPWRGVIQRFCSSDAQACTGGTA